jgi:hypothetical protein
LSVYLGGLSVYLGGLFVIEEDKAGRYRSYGRLNAMELKALVEKSVDGGVR